MCTFQILSKIEQNTNGMFSNIYRGLWRRLHVSCTYLKWNKRSSEHSLNVKHYVNALGKLPLPEPEPKKIWNKMFQIVGENLQINVRMIAKVVNTDRAIFVWESQHEKIFVLRWSLGFSHKSKNNPVWKFALTCCNLPTTACALKTQSLPRIIKSSLKQVQISHPNYVFWCKGRDSEKIGSRRHNKEPALL